MSCKLHIAYPVPMETPEVRELFWPDVVRFAQSFLAHDPGVDDYTLFVLTCGAYADDALKELFLSAKVRPVYLRYDDAGCDLGAQQYLAKREPKAFQINFTSRMIIHQPGWAARIRTARLCHGRGLYGMSASREGGKLHLCTRGHALDAKDLADYPTLINSRELGKYFENGDGCLLDWANARDLEAFIVHWDGTYDKSKWFTVPNRFRHGDQSNVLCWDRHTEIYRNASAGEKTELERLAEGAPHELPA